MQIELTDMVRQDSTINPREDGAAPAYLAFHRDGDAHLFHDFCDARDFALRQIEDGDELVWGVFPLYAGAEIEIDD